MLVDRDPDQNGIHAFRRRVQLMQCVPLECVKLALAVLTRKIRLNDEFAVLDKEHAVNVFVRIVVDPFKQILDQVRIEVLTTQGSRLPTVIHLFRYDVLICREMIGGGSGYRTSALGQADPPPIIRSEEHTSE